MQSALRTAAAPTVNRPFDCGWLPTPDHSSYCLVEPIPFVRAASTLPSLPHQVSAVARSGAQGWRASAPPQACPRQPRARRHADPLSHNFGSSGSWSCGNAGAYGARRTMFLQVANGVVSVRKAARIRLAQETRSPSVHGLSEFSHSQGHSRRFASLSMSKSRLLRRHKLTYHAGRLSRAIIRTRIGFRTTKAKMAATILSADATMNTAVQPPVAAVSTLPSGTRSAAVPLAV